MRRTLLALLLALAACGKTQQITSQPGHLSVLNGAADVSNASDDFGQSCPGFPVTQTLTLSNTGDVLVTIKNVQLSGSDFTLMPAPSLPLTVAPSSSVTLTLSFSPPAGSAGGQAGTLTFTSDAQNPTVTVNLTGTVSSAAPQPTLATSCLVMGQPRTPCTFLDFSGVPVGSSASQTVTLSNTGCPPLTLAAQLVGDAGYATGAVPPQLQLGASAPLSVTFAPAGPGAASGKLVLSTNDPQGGIGQDAGVFVLSLTGFGTQAQLTLSPTSWAAGGVAPGTTVGQTFTVVNGGGVGIALGAPAILEADDAGAFVLDAGWPSGFLLDAGASVSCVVTADLPAAGAYGASLVVPYGSSQLLAALTANAISSLCASPSQLVFDAGLLCGPPVTESLQLFVCDGGDSPIDLSAVQISPNPGNLYTLTLPAGGPPWTVTPGGAPVTVGVTYQNGGTQQTSDAVLAVTSSAFSQAAFNVNVSNATPAYVPPAGGVPVYVDGGAPIVGQTLLFQVQPATDAQNYAYQFYWVGQSGSDAGPVDAGLLVLTGVSGADVAFTPEVATSAPSGGYRVCVDEVEIDAGFGSCGFDAGNGTGRSSNCSQVITVGP